MITKEQLQPFCSTDEPRYILATPSTRGAHTWATDGRIIVRVPAMPDVPAVENYPDTSTTWCGFNPDADFQPLPQLPEPIEDAAKRCTHCSGTGEAECHACGQDTECEDCDGTGVYMPRDLRWMMIGGGGFAMPLLLKIAALPNARFAVTGRVDDGKMACFVFDGGAGIVMGLTRVDGLTNEWKPEEVEQPERAKAKDATP